MAGYEKREDENLAHKTNTNTSYDVKIAAVVRSKQPAHETKQIHSRVRMYIADHPSPALGTATIHAISHLHTTPTYLSKVFQRLLRVGNLLLLLAYLLRRTIPSHHRIITSSHHDNGHENQGATKSEFRHQGHVGKCDHEPAQRYVCPAL